MRLDIFECSSCDGGHQNVEIISTDESENPWAGNKDVKYIGKFICPETGDSVYTYEI